MGRFSAQHYLHIRSGGWQWPIAMDAIVELRDQVTRATVLALPAALVVIALAHYAGQAQLTAQLLPGLPAIRAPKPPGTLDQGRRGLRGVRGRRLRGYAKT